MFVKEAQVSIVKCKKREKLKIIGCGTRSSCGLGFEFTVVVGLDEVLVGFVEGRKGGGFSFGDFVEFSNVISVEFVLLLSVSELNVGLAHFSFFPEVI